MTEMKNYGREGSKDRPDYGEVEGDKIKGHDGELQQGRQVKRMEFEGQMGMLIRKMEEY